MAQEITFQLADQDAKSWSHMLAPHEVIWYRTGLIKEENQKALLEGSSKCLKPISVISCWSKLKNTHILKLYRWRWVGRPALSGSSANREMLSPEDHVLLETQIPAHFVDSAGAGKKDPVHEFTWWHASINKGCRAQSSRGERVAEVSEAAEQVVDENTNSWKRCSIKPQVRSCCYSR